MVTTVDADKNCPAVDVKTTGADLKALPLMSSTLAVIVVGPPAAGTVAGLALTVTRPTAAVPIAILSAPAVPVVAPPENALIVAVPLDAPDLNVTLTWPLMSVSTEDGSIVPSVVVKVIRVPLCGGVPLLSATWATIGRVAFVGSAVFPAVSTIVEPVGASKGTLSQVTETRQHAAARARTGRRKRVNMKPSNILIPMKLRGQAYRRRRERAGPRPSIGNEVGYAMAALLVAMGVMAVLMTMVMPVWKQMTQREKEAELVFRGQQYTRAIGLFQRKLGTAALPPNLDVLVDQHFLRHKYKDPITGEDFLLIPAAVPAGAQAQLQAAQTTNQTIGLPNRTQTSTASPYVAQGGPFGSNVPGGITGVVSKSPDTSIRVYNGRSHYNEWEFRYVAPPTPQQGGAAGGRGTPQRGQPTGGPNGPGGPGGLGGRGGPNDGRGGAGRGGPVDGRGRGPQGGPNGLPGPGPGPATGGRGAGPGR